MKNKKNCNKIKRSLLSPSLKKEITIIFVAIMALAFISCWFINNVFLEKFYILNKEKTLMNLYTSLKTEAAAGNLFSENFDLELQKYSGTHNVSIVIVENEYVKVYSSEPLEYLTFELKQCLSGIIYADRIVYQSDECVFFQKKDLRMQTDFLEIVGKLPNGSTFLARSAVESIKLSADIANRFFLYIGLGAVLISAFVIYFFTRKISKPILELADISERMSHMDFDAKYDGKEKTEIALLGNSINKMSENLERTISELQNANIKLKKDYDVMAEADKMRREFIANASHELKTPIALIQGYSEGLKEGINEEDERDYYCDVIIDEASKMNTIVKNLLLLNQIESGADMLQCEMFDLVSLVKNYIQSAEILTKQNNIKVTCDLPEKCNVFADEFKIEEVFMNYFSNALNHCEDDNEKQIDVTLKKEENDIKVSVFNTGKQIPEESIEHIWEKFYKVDKARTREYGGSGIGLSIVKAIMDAHNGKYGVENRENGVVFWFSLNANNYPEE
ncbi:MAG: HAMP domain-containing histidine kinase [Lachnospiraceae bacterium]|nr:HAMP domain-containing histidine kinase [Lachnospiraceae bacterium]